MSEPEDTSESKVVCPQPAQSSVYRDKFQDKFRDKFLVLSKSAGCATDVFMNFISFKASL